MTELNPITWARTIRKMTAAGTLRQSVWNDVDEGRYIACLLGASSPDVNGVEDVNCAALCMPEWLAELTPPLFDGVPKDQASVYALRYADVAERWCVLTPEAWDRVSVTFRVACIEQALSSAEAMQLTPRPDYWAAVEAACEAMIEALKDDDEARTSWAAGEAGAAWEAAEAAGATWMGAAWAARAAEAADMAEVEAGAADAAGAAEAAGAAGAAGAAYSRLFDVLLDAITAEVVLAAMKEIIP